MVSDGKTEANSAAAVAKRLIDHMVGDWLISVGKRMLSKCYTIFRVLVVMIVDSKSVIQRSVIEDSSKHYVGLSQVQL